MGWLNDKLFVDLSRRSREKKVAILRDNVDLTRGGRILDVGGQVDYAQAQLLETLPDRSNVTAVNLFREHLEEIAAAYPDVETRVADARDLPFEDDSFDLVYSNAVIEHVGSFEDQRAMAREVMRVGRNWFITTPNRWFPFEFHYRLPFVSWLPSPLMVRIGEICSFDHVERRYRSGVHERIRLLTRREMRELFPTSRVTPVRITVWPETLVAIGGEDFSQRS